MAAMLLLSQSTSLPLGLSESSRLHPGVGRRDFAIVATGSKQQLHNGVLMCTLSPLPWLYWPGPQRMYGKPLPLQAGSFGRVEARGAAFDSHQYVFLPVYICYNTTYLVTLACSVKRHNERAARSARILWKF